MNTNFQGTNRFMNRLFKSTADRHYFACRFHLRTQLTVRMNELVERPAWNFTYNIVKCRLKACIGLSGNRIDDFIQRVTHRDFGSHFGNRISSCFGRQSRGTADTRVYFDYIILITLRIKCELYVTSTLNIQGANDFERSRAQHLVFAI
ncbi:hypothetical protein D3C78_833760 [compost metagenome]